MRFELLPGGASYGCRSRYALRLRCASFRATRSVSAESFEVSGNKVLFDSNLIQDFVGTSNSRMSTSSTMAISLSSFSVGWLSLLQIQVIVFGALCTRSASSFSVARAAFDRAALLRLTLIDVLNANLTLR